MADDLPEDDTDDTPLKERGANLAKGKKIRECLLDLYKDVEKGFEDQLQRSSDQQDYWDIYNCKLGSNQFYSGNSRIFLPMVYNAVNARKTRFANQIFPQSGRYVEVTTQDGTIPHPIMALAEHYVRKAHLRELMPAIMRNGDVEGQYNVYIDWSERERHIVRKVKAPVKMGEGLAASGDEVDDIEEETIKAAHPTVEVLADADVLIVPATSTTPEDAIAAGGSATIIRRWGKSKIRALIKDNQIDSKIGEDLIEEMSKDQRAGGFDKAKAMVDAAGIKSTGSGKHALVYETWSNVKTTEGMRLCRTYFGGQDKVLSCVRNPFWSDKLPLISVPLERVQGSVKGVSRVQSVADLQYLANDTVNESADSMAYGLMPIIMTDPEKNPKIGTMVLSLAAVWETNPADTRFAEFPKLWKDGFEIIASIQQQIFQTLSVNPSQITQGSKKKQSQAEVANEQQVDMLTTADVVTVIEGALLTPIIERFIELDHQFRDEAISTRAYGELGMKAAMQDIDPIQMGRRFQFRWLGVEAARNAQQMQQQIAMLNVVKGIPAQMYQGYKLNLAPIIAQMIENTFGPRLAPLIFEDIRSQLSVDPQKENMLLASGHHVTVHPMDNVQEHMQVHMMGMAQGDEHGTFREHMMAHQMAAAMQAKAQQDASQGGGQGGPPGAPQGGPKQGAQPSGPRAVQGPPGMVRRDQMKDPAVMPRRMG